MKSSKSIRQHYATSERKNGKRSEKSAKLDRKSSRGMIYENEELRLRTININAEVERGQSDIKRLRRENEHLRREIWTLRDECDRLNKRFKARLVEASHDHRNGCNLRGSGASGGCSGRRGSCDGAHSNSNSEESDSCDTCRGDNDDIYVEDDFKYAPPNDCCLDGSCQAASAKSQQQQLVERMAAKFNHTQTNAGSKTTASDEDQQLHTSFDHLSVVSEETLSNSEVVSTTIQPVNLLGYNQDVNGSQSTLPSLVRPLTPLTPVELIANELHDLQSAVPPLSYFENIVQQHMGPNSGSQSDSAKTTNSGKTVIQTNGWDYNLQSPFTQRKYPSNSSSSSSTSRSPAQALTTFVPPTSTLSPHYISEPTLMSRTNVPTIETVAITTVSPSSVATINSPKHFFSPLKPRLKINTTLANRNFPAAMAPPVPPVVPPNYNPPDIFVSNALASPYHRPGVATATTSVLTSSANVLSTSNAAGHALQQRQSQQVSPRQRRRRHNHQQHHQHQHHHHSEHRQHHHQHVATADIYVTNDDAGANSVSATTVVAAAAAAAGLKEITFPTAHQMHEPQNQQELENFNQIYTTKLNEPIYATAHKRCNNLITAPAVTKPLMTTTIVTTTLPPSTTTFSTNSSYVSSTTTITATTTTTATKTSTFTTMTVVGQKQTDSANLEAILNDIETISEDILAIQLEKNKSRENLTETHAQRKLQQNDKNKKPYRSEMNLLLSYEGSNPTITPTTSVSTGNTNVGMQDGIVKSTADNYNTARRARSLEREHTDSPSPNVPDPMAPFPNNRTYIGFDQLNAAVGTAKPPLPPSQITMQATAAGGGSKPGTPIKPAPPTPPTRKHPIPLTSSQASTTPSVTPTANADQLEQQRLASSPSVAGLTPNKSHLFAALANAAVAKRAQFRAMPLHLTRSLDTDRMVMPATEQDSQAAETVRRKGRRVSIVCNNNIKDAGVAQTTTASPTTTPAALGSCIDLQAPNPVIMHLRQTSHSTPNSPHSMRRGSYSIIETPNVGAPHQHSHPPTGPYAPHQPQQSKGSISGQQRKASQDSPRVALNSAAPDLAAAAAAAVASRSKCSRRHSDSTVASGKLRTSGVSIRQHHHHNHSHQQHLHPTPLISSNPHHSHQDSNHDTGTSISDRNSNSLASSRESSTSFSMRSQRRKISVSSHTGGKIPWCGCWGNGCL